MIGAGKYHYYRCASGQFIGKVYKWASNPDWPHGFDEWLGSRLEDELPLGEPMGDGVKGSDGVWTRSFKSGTKVMFDGTLGNGTIVWSDGTIQYGYP